MGNLPLSRALQIAMSAHEGQVDRACKPYILHPLTVAASMDTEAGFITALLHDVLEDSDYTAKDLRQAGFPAFIVEALCLLTRDKDEPYMDYIRKIKGNNLARVVKLADLKHNSDLSRLAVVTDSDRARAEKYKQAIKLLAE